MNEACPAPSTESPCSLHDRLTVIAGSFRNYNEPVTERTQVDLMGVGLNATDTVIPLDSYPERGAKVEYSGRSTGSSTSPARRRP